MMLPVIVLQQSLVRVTENSESCEKVNRNDSLSFLDWTHPSFSQASAGFRRLKETLRALRNSILTD